MERTGLKRLLIVVTVGLIIVQIMTVINFDLFITSILSPKFSEDEMLSLIRRLMYIWLMAISIFEILVCTYFVKRKFYDADDEEKTITFEDGNIQVLNEG